jgi:hypothetical protein
VSGRRAGPGIIPSPSSPRPTSTGVRGPDRPAGYNGDVFGHPVTLLGTAFTQPHCVFYSPTTMWVTRMVTFGDAMRCWPNDYT